MAFELTDRTHNNPATGRHDRRASARPMTPVCLRKFSGLWLTCQASVAFGSKCVYGERDYSTAAHLAAIQVFSWVRVRVHVHHP